MARFSDAQLVIVMQKSARRLNRRLRLFGTSNEIAVDSSGNMTPANNGSLEDLLLLQAECLIANIDANTDVSEGGIYVVDGEQTFDNRGKALARLSYLDSPANPCKELEDAIIDYQLTTGFTGKAIW